ncbi:MAG: hypothetical protein ACI9YU_000731 [Flavobacteriales bacterium]|jgi:uncharacterized protein (TIRG00374 family)
MKKIAGNTLKVGLPLAFGIYVIYYQYNQLEPDQVEEIKQSFRDADYFWVLLSLVFGTLSHVSRAYRWRYTLSPLGIQVRFLNSFFAVMIGYLANIIFPRLGEVSRCAVISKYEHQPFEKLFGTVLAERVADMLILLSVIVVVLILQMDVLQETLITMLEKAGDPKTAIIKLIVVAAVGLALMIAALVVFKVSKHPFIMKVKDLLAGLLDGVLSIIRMEKKWTFIAHTAFIWFMYMLMFYVAFYALPETSNVPIAGILASFVMGGLSIVLVQGGIGVYPLSIALVLSLYGLSTTTGLTLGWIIWTGQTIMLIGWGAISLVAMPLYNRSVEVPSA